MYEIREYRMLTTVLCLTCTVLETESFLLFFECQKQKQLNVTVTVIL